MKKFTILFAALLLTALPMMAERVDPEAARKVATTFLQNNGAKTAQMVDLSNSAGFENIYIFSTESSFVILAADDCANPILGYSLNGKFFTERMPESMRSWLQGYSDEIQYAIDNQVRADAETSKEWKDLLNSNPKAGKATAVVNALVQTQWDQEGTYYYIGGQYQLIELYNNLCPVYYSKRTVTGCVATAMAQIMKYWSKPAKGIGYHSYTPESLPSLGEQFADFGATTYDWDNMPNQLNYNSTEAEKMAVATLMYHCGVSVNMDYNTSSSGGSGAVSKTIVPALYNYFGYKLAEFKEKSSYSDNEWSNMIKAELDAARPVQYNGSGSAGGHAFICDGYNNSNQFHFNWGWSGQNDGYYALSSLNPGSGGAGGGSYNFTNDQTAIFGIQPSGCTLDAPTNLSHTLEGIQNVTLTWDAVSGATSYNVYRDFYLVGNTTSTTITDIARFGSNHYWVRCIDANNELSLASEYEIVNVDFQMPIVNDLAVSYPDNNISLSWTTPDWCFPETPSNTLTYGNQIPTSTFFPWSGSMYWGHRHLSNTLSAYEGMEIYSVDFYAYNAGTYELSIYEGEPNATKPSTLVCTQTVSVSATGWYSFDLPNPHILDKTKDLWVFIHNPELIDGLRAYLCTSSGEKGCYYTGNPLSYTNSYSGYAFLLKTYLTDGSYTYNLYQDGTVIVENLNSTSYNATLNDNATNLFTVKTNYYAGETDASNRIGFAKGSSSLNSWEMAANDKMALTEGSILTVSGNLVNTNPDNLILENGAQLIHNTDGVKATVKKGITPYTGDNGWNFIASPVMEALTPSEENGFLNGTVGEGNNTYDLYYYNEPEYLWMNYEAETFDLVHQQGYLYANGQTGGTTLQFAGTLTPSNNSVTIDNLSHSASILKGFNLVGNPFVCNATIDKDFYVIDNPTNTVALAQPNAVIAPCEGVFVQASEENASVTFSKAASAKGISSKECFDMVITQDKTTADRARVRFGKGTGMEKFSLDDKHSQISLWQDGKYYAVAYTNGATELPLNFKAKKDGTYTLSIEAENLELNYLHLIDNLTGEDTDLLSTPSYSFEAQTTDFASRFRLVFSNCEDAVGDNDAFAYLSNGNIIVNNEDNATMQIVDATGRLVASYDGRIQCVPTRGMASGVYVLLLITDNGMKTQKLIIE